MSHAPRPRALFLPFALFAVVLTTSCASTASSRPVRHSGFLSDYDRLEVSGGGQAWSDVAFTPAEYKAVHVAAVELRLDAADSEGPSPESLAPLAERYRELAVEKLVADGWAIVGCGEPGTLTVRLALTEAIGANRVCNALTSLPSVTTAVLRLASLATDVHFCVGKASTEIQVVDSATGRVLVESLARRVGTHSPWNIGSTWADVDDALCVWTDSVAERLSREEGSEPED